MSEYLANNIRGFHEKHTDEIPELYPRKDGNLTISFKNFMIDHITNYWPCVFREIANEWPAVKKWSDPEYLKKLFGQEKMLVGKINSGEITPYFSPDYNVPTE